VQTLVHAADVPDGPGGLRVLEALEPVQARFPRLCHLWVDAAYRGTVVSETKARLGWSVEVVKHWWTGVSKVWVAPGEAPPEKPTGFHVLPRRWVVERTFVWLSL
jgi:transposase